MVCFIVNLHLQLLLVAVPVRRLYLSLFLFLSLLFLLLRPRSKPSADPTLITNPPGLFTGTRLTRCIEYRNKTLTRALGSAKIGCYVLAATIFSLSLFRDSLYVPPLPFSPSPPLRLLKSRSQWHADGTTGT